MNTTQRSRRYGRTGVSSADLERLAECVPTLEDRPTIAVRTPIDDEPIGSIPACRAADVEEAVDRARAAQAAWRETPIDERVAIVDRFADRVLEERDRLLDVLQLETGKARTDAFEELLDVLQTCTYYCNTAASTLAAERRSGPFPIATVADVHYRPVGVVGVITPWNYPANLVITDVIPALLAGNAVVCKPDERTSYIALALKRLLDGVGLPEDLFQVVTGEGDLAGAALIDTVDHIAFTGGTATGRIVGEAAGRNLIGCSLELGGKNAAIVLADADVERAARGIATGAFTNAGQLCLAPEIVYVDETIADRFLDAFVGETRGLTLGLAFDYGPDVGSLIDADHLERVDGYVHEAIDEGASIVSGGRRRPDVGPFCYEPTVLTDVEADASIACEETFGPIVSVIPVTDAEAAIARTNDSPYGLNASVWTADRDRGRAVARELEYGTVCINDSYVVGWAAIDAPMGGVGDSGLGRRHGPEGLRRYLEPQTIATSRVGPLARPSMLPYRWFARTLTGWTRIQRTIGRWRQ